MGIRTIMTHFAHNVWKHSATIALVAGTVGLVADGVYIAFVAPEAKKALDEAMSESEEFEAMDYIRTLAPYYWKPAAIAAISVGCIAFSGVKFHKTQMGLTAALGVMEKQLIGIEEGVVKELGEKKSGKIFDNANQTRAENGEIVEKDIISTGKGEDLWMDASTNTPFRCSAEAIRQAQDIIKFRIWTDDYASVNDLYYEIGLPLTDFGQYLGWNIKQFESYSSFAAFRDGVNLLDLNSADSRAGRAYMIMAFNLRGRIVPIPDYDRY